MGAEANNRGNISDDKAQMYLNRVRERAFGNATNNTSATGNALTTEIYQERKLELVGEGHQFFDLVRTGRAASQIQGFQSGKNEVFPIPAIEIALTGNRWTQNQGYENKKIKIMKTLKYVLSLFLVIATIISCSQDDDITNIAAVAAPTNISALIVVTPDNSGDVTITPLGDGVSTFKVNYGDGSSNNPEELQPGDSVNNTYQEGVYQIVITGIGINGKTTTITKELIVSFLAPQNLVVNIENDPNVSRKVNVTATADLAISYEVNFGDTNSTVVAGNNGDEVSFTYDTAGVYTIIVTAMSAATETTIYTEDFTVTEILTPVVAAPIPPVRQDVDKISMFSNAYNTDINVSSWRSDWSTSTLTDLQITGDDTKEYIDADFVGVEFYGADAVDASVMEMFHLDVWTANADIFRVKLVDLGSNTEGEIEFSGITQGQWVSLEIPMADFITAGMTTTNGIQQLIFSGLPTGTFDFYIDNVYFYRAPTAPTSPVVAAPNPTQAQANVINMYSNTFTQDVNISSWRSDWSTSTLTDIQVVGNDTKEYIDADFVGVEFYGADAVDASTMDFFHIDVWTPNADTFRVKLVDLGSNTEGEIEFSGIAQSEWVSLDIPMSDFVAAGMTTTNAIQQLIFSGLPTGTFDFYIDNVYFYQNVATVPVVAAPIPTDTGVINMYSDIYTQDVNVSSWRSDWSTSTLTDIQVVGNNTKEYIDADFVGVEFYGADAVDASGMAFFHVDIWTPNADTFRVKLVDLGSNTEGEIEFSGIAQGQWVSLDIPMADFVTAGMTTTNSIQQLIFSGLPTGTFDFYIDNVYFHN
jgi:hypothetical protein